MNYRLHGLNFSSEIELPLWPAGEGRTDATIRRGSVPRQVPDSQHVGTVFSGRRGSCVLRYSEVGFFLVESGNAIVVEQTSPTPDWLRLFLSGTVVALLLHQRGRVCLHASSVVVDGRAHLVVGASGAGKSTTAAALVERGATLLAEDITAIDFAPDGQMVAFPGLQTLRLHPESVAALPSHAATRAPRDRADEKYLIPLPGAESKDAFPVASISFLRRGQVAAPTATPVVGAARVATIEKNLFRPRMARIVGDPARRFELCTRLAAHASLREICRPAAGFHLDRLCACILGANAN